jgi:hypothetical protein
MSLDTNVLAQTSDGEFSQTIRVQHDKKELKDFVKDWGKAYDTVVRAFNKPADKNPHDNTVDGMYTVLRKKGYVLTEIELSDTTLEFP